MKVKKDIVQNRSSLAINCADELPSAALWNNSFRIRDHLHSKAQRERMFRIMMPTVSFTFIFSSLQPSALLTNMVTSMR